MLWHDFFYFSKGERRSLIVLLCLITVAGIILIWNDPPEPGANTGQADTLVDSGKSENVSIATDSLLSSRSSGGESSSSPAKPALSKKNAPSSGNRLSSSSLSSESVQERVKRLTSSSRPSYVRTEKFSKGTVVELNTADTVILKKVPGIGSAFSKRIVNYRDLLGGYYSVTQLSEVYGIDEEKYNALMPWFSADPSLISRLKVNDLPQDSLRRHPYINYGQAKVITQMRKQKGKLTGWENLLLLNEFTDGDRIRLQHYLSFE